MDRTAVRMGKAGKQAKALVRSAERFSLGKLLGIGRSGGWTGALSGAVVAAACSPAFAGPQGAQVVRGDVSISHNGNETLIQAGRNSIINYRSFDIGAGETVRFVQPDSKSRVLNRITTAAPTRIDGSLISNGIVYIVNPAGVLFSKGATVNVSGLYAAGGKLSDQDFLHGNNHFTNLKGDVANQGSITAGYAAIVGKHVENVGTIVAPRGTVMMASGQDVMIGERGGNVFVRIHGSSDAAAGGAGTDNAGNISAPGGRVVMGAGDIYSMAVRSTGTVQAKSIKLEGQGGGEVRASGTLDASNQGSNSTGGSIDVLGKQVSVVNARLDASGANGGGTINIGGDYQGKGDRRKADQAFVGSGSTLDVSATQNGSGGTAVVWSQERTQFYGQALAKGAGSGAGGLVETSSHNTVDLNPAKIDVTAPSGKGGTWLIDPRNVNISTDADTDITAAPNFEPSAPASDPAHSDPSILNVTTLQNALTGGATVIVTTFQTGNNGTQAGDITVSAPIDSPGDATLKLFAANNIVINAPIQGVSTHTLNLDLQANNGHDHTNAGAVDDLDTANGSVFINAPVLTRGGSFAASGVDFTNAASIGTDGGEVGVVSTGNVALNAPIAAGSGDITVSGNAITQAAVVTGGSYAVSGQGAVSINTAATATGAGGMSLRSGLSGSGDLTFGSGVDLTADSMTLSAGNGTGSAAVHAADSTLLFHGNAPGSSPTSFIVRQDHAIAAADLPDVAQFGGGIAGMAYTVNSTNGSVTIDDNAKVSGSALTLTSSDATAAGIQIATDLSLASLHVTTGVTLSNGVTTSGGNIALDGSVLVAGNIPLDTTNGGATPTGANITIGGAVDADQSANIRRLALKGGTGGAVTLSSDVGATQPLEAIAATGGTLAIANVTTRGNQRYNGDLTLSGSLHSTVTGVINVQGGVALAHDGISIQTAGLQSTDDIAISGDINSDSTARDLTLDAGIAHITAGRLGASAPGLAAISAHGGAISLTSAVTTGSQTYTGPLTIAGDLTSGGSVTVNGPLLLAHSATITGSSPVEFNGTIKSQHGQALTLAVSAPTTIFDGDIGGNAGSGDELGSLTVGGGGTIGIHSGSINTTGAQTYGGNTTVFT